MTSELFILLLRVLMSLAIFMCELSIYVNFKLFNVNNVILKHTTMLKYYCLQIACLRLFPPFFSSLERKNTCYGYWVFHSRSSESTKSPASPSVSQITEKVCSFQMKRLCEIHFCILRDTVRLHLRSEFSSFLFVVGLKFIK